jgi:hypothetical protein
MAQGTISTTPETTIPVGSGARRAHVEGSADRKRMLWFWLASFLAFPVGGLLARVVGPVDEVGVAIVAGAIAGAVIGAGQWLVLRTSGIDARWIFATAAGLAVGLAVGTALVDYGISVSDLAVVGAFSGLGVGLAQWPLLRRRVRASVVWIPATAALWALGWVVTSQVIKTNAEEHFAVFGASGAITVALLSGALLWALGLWGRTSKEMPS